MRLRSRLLLSLLAVIGVMTVPAVYAAARVHTVRGLVHEIRTGAAQAANAVGLLRRGVSDLDRLERAYVATVDPQLEPQVERALARIEEQTRVLRTLGYGDRVVASALPLVALRQTTDSLRSLVEADSLESATAFLNAAAVPLLHSSDAAVARLSQAIDESTTGAADEADDLASTASATAGTAILVAMLLAVVLAWLAARVHSGPLERLRRAMMDVANGRFEAQTDAGYGRSDEVGDLFRSFRTMATQLSELDRTKAELVGIATHDLKTPVSIIAGYAELLDEEMAGKLEPRQRELLLNLVGQARALSARADHLMEISRMEARGIRPGLEEIKIRHFARGVERAFAPVARGRQVRLHVHSDASTPPLIVADPDSLRGDILGNLLENAFKFTAPGGRVEVRFLGEPGWLVVEVEDDGLAVTTEEAAHVFDRYFQGRAPSGRAGSGAGLPIARAAAEAHGGRVAAVPRGDSGVVFRVEIPVRPPTGAPASRARARVGAAA